MSDSRPGKSGITVAERQNLVAHRLEMIERIDPEGAAIIRDELRDLECQLEAGHLGEHEWSGEGREFGAGSERGAVQVRIRWADDFPLEVR